MPLSPELEAEFAAWLDIEAEKNERLLKIMKMYEKEAILQFWMYRMGYKNRQYALQKIKIREV